MYHSFYLIISNTIIKAERIICLLMGKIIYKFVMENGLLFLILGEILLAKPLSDIFSMSHMGQPLLVKVVAEEIRTNPEEAPSQSTTIQLAFIPPATIINKSTFFSAIEYITLLDENSPSGTVLRLAQATINVEPGTILSVELQNNNGTCKMLKHFDKN